MKYLEIRDKIKTGDLLAWSEGGPWTSWRNVQLNLIRMGTGSTYNHVGVAYVVGGRVFVVEAVVPEVRIFPLSRLTPFYWIPVPFEATETTEKHLLNFVGMRYSKWEAIKSAFTTDTNNEKVIQCAKLVNAIYSEFDYNYINLHDTPAAVVLYTTVTHNSVLTYVD